jgi:hypothetical protein
MPNIPDFKTMSQDLVTKAADAVDSALGSVKEQAERTGASIEKVVDLVPTPRQVVDQVTATANELLALSQDVQNKVIAALTSNA